MKKMTRNEFLKIAGASAALVAFNTVLTPAAFAATPKRVITKDVNKTVQEPAPLSFYGVKPLHRHIFFQTFGCENPD